MYFPFATLLSIEVTIIIQVKPDIGHSDGPLLLQQCSVFPTGKYRSAG